jgi:hypothetical protein
MCIGGFLGYQVAHQIYEKNYRNVVIRMSRASSIFTVGQLMVAIIIILSSMDLYDEGDPR